MNPKAFILGTALGLFLFWGTWQLYIKKQLQQPEPPPITDKNIDEAVTAYQMALNDNAPVSVLTELNQTYAKDYGLKVYQRRTDGKIVVSNLDGKEIKAV